MFQRYSATVILASLISAFAWWSNPAPISGSGPRVAPVLRVTSDFRYLAQHHQELLEGLKQLILSQHRYRAKNGNFTRILTKLDYSVSRKLADRFGFIVEQAGANELLISGFSEVDGKTGDRASLTHDFELSASFPITGEHVVLMKRQGHQQLADLSAVLDRQDRRIALNDSGQHHEPEKKILSDLIRRMPAQAPLRPGQREDTAELVIEPIDLSGSESL